jgi:hypothetical protein
MSNPLWRETGPGGPYGGEPDDGPRRDTRASRQQPRAAPGGGWRDAGRAAPGGGWRDAGRAAPGGGWRDAGRAAPGGSGPRADPGWDGRDPGWGDPGARTRRLPAQPASGGVPPGTAARAARPRSGPPGPRGPRRGRGRSRWGSLQGGLGVVIVIAGASLGVIASVATGRAPGFLLGLCVVAATVCAALAVRPGAGRMILPVPALSYLVAALVTGMVTDRPASPSRTALLIAAAQWIADGFFAMALATALAAVLVTARWLLRRRRRGSGQAGGWSAPPAAGRRGRGGAPPDYRDRRAGDGRPGADPRAGPGGRWTGGAARPAWPPGPPGAPGSPGRRPGAQPGSGGPARPPAPYNFSSGA